MPTSVALILLIVGSAHSAPSISLQSFTDYHLAANTTNLQDCSSANATLAGFACGNSSPVVISINGDGLCSSSNDTRCFFSPALSSITTGTSVIWRDLGNLYHNIIFNATDSPASLPPFSIYVYPNSYSSSQQFFIAGTYHYYDSNRLWMKGALVVAPAVAPPPIVTSFGADGSVGWNVAGFSRNDVVLGVTHKINVYNQSANPWNLVYNDSGILEQYIDLSSREESPSIVNLLSSLPYGLGFSGFYGGTGPGFGGFGYPPYYGGPPYSFQPAHTLWWIDGPLDNGSVVELLSGYASITGTKMVQLGYPLNIQDAGWTVTLVYAANSNQTQPSPSNNFYYYPCGYGYFGGPQPQPQCFVSESSLSVQLTAVYGKRSDLLLGFSAIISTLTQTTTRYPAGSTVYASNNGYGNGVPVSAPVSIQRTTSSKLTLTLSLSNTNIDLSKRITVQTPSGSTSTSTTNTGGGEVNSPSPTSNQPLSSSLIYFLGGAGIATAICGLVWAFLRDRRRQTVVVRSLVPAPAS